MPVHPRREMQKVFPIEIPCQSSQEKLTTKDARKKRRKSIPNRYQHCDIANMIAKIAAVMGVTAEMTARRSHDLKVVRSIVASRTLMAQLRSQVRQLARAVSCAEH